jgi:hypothetical protein
MKSGLWWILWRQGDRRCRRHTTCWGVRATSGRLGLGIDQPGAGLPVSTGTMLTWATGAGQRTAGQDTLLLGEVALGVGEVAQAPAVRGAFLQLIEDALSNQVELSASAREDETGIIIDRQRRGDSGLGFRRWGFPSGFGALAVGDGGGLWGE